jgi:hypothetical protein
LKIKLSGTVFNGKEIFLFNDLMQVSADPAGLFNRDLQIVLLDRRGRDRKGPVLSDRAAFSRIEYFEGENNKLAREKLKGYPGIRS